QADAELVDADAVVDAAALTFGPALAGEVAGELDADVAAGLGGTDQVLGLVADHGEVVAGGFAVVEVAGGVAVAVVDDDRGVAVGAVAALAQLGRPCEVAGCGDVSHGRALLHASFRAQAARSARWHPSRHCFARLGTKRTAVASDRGQAAHRRGRGSCARMLRSTQMP